MRRVREFVCNYAIARFRPYRETGEFANVGVVLLCPEVDYFGYAFERHKYKRITNFFPELDSNIFKAGLSGFLKELSRVTSRERRQPSLSSAAKLKPASRSSKNWSAPARQYSISAKSEPC